MRQAMEIQKLVQTEAQEIKNFEAEYRKVLNNKQQLTEKKSENEMVLTEFNLLDEAASVYKLVGPILAKQELSEAKDNVQKRIAFMDKEIARQVTLENEFQKKINYKTESIKKHQQNFQKLVMAAQQQTQAGVQQ